MILGVHHPAISVPSMDEALAFYRDKLGFEAVMEIELPSMDMMTRAMDLDDAAYKVAMLRKGNSCIELFEFTGEDVPAADAKRPVSKHGITHICLAADEYEKDYETLREAGVVFNTEPNGEAPGRWVYGRDPFGNVIELLEHNPESPSAIDFAR
ncbi:MAG: VOC family protein [Myxococcota bacterium]|jgi:catechol 2,3-dioxygenase-like lactoylglutathione lyase family enzyme|nr:VOC family protein [Myxococcota bacterium]